MKAIRVWIVLALVFLAGFAGGVVTTRAVARRVIANAVAKPELVQMRIERELDRRLRLDEKQRAQVHDILADSHEHMRSLRKEFQPQFASILEDTRDKISALLDPEQQKRFEKMQAEHRPLLPAR